MHTLDLEMNALLFWSGQNQGEIYRYHDNLFEVILSLPHHKAVSGIQVHPRGRPI